MDKRTKILQDSQMVCVGCAQVKGINYFTHVSSYLSNDNNNDSYNDNDVIHIIIIMRTMAIIIQSSLLFFE